MSEHNFNNLTEVLAAAPNMQQEALTQYFKIAEAPHNMLSAFTSTFDVNAAGKGQSSVFCETTELNAGGKQKVHFNTIGMPAGPGVRGNARLTGNESVSSMLTYFAEVDWIRDAIVLDEDQIAHLGAGGNLKRTVISLIAQKMGLVKQNQTLRRLIDYAYNLATPANWANGKDRGNVYRVGNRANIHALRPDDVLSLDVSNTTRSMLNTLGGKPLRKDTSKNGSPINKFLMLATDQAFLPIRNDSLFATAKDADIRGANNANFTGELLDWQGNPFYEMPVQDHAWDDYKGGPLIAKAAVSVAAGPATAGGPKLIVNAANTKSLYFQWFDGYSFPHSRQEVATQADLSTIEYYGWACNPDGSRVFFAYAGNQNGNQVAITKILSPAVSGTTIDVTTVGQLTCGTNALNPSGIGATKFLGGGDSNLPTGWEFSNTIQVGAVILQANAQGTTYTRSLVLASCAAVIAHGKIKMKLIEDTDDYDFIHGQGYQMIFGTGVALDAIGRPNGYILIEHAIEHVGYRCPAKV